jgi:hypothetical protein
MEKQIENEQKTLKKLSLREIGDKYGHLFKGKPIPSPEEIKQICADAVYEKYQNSRKQS